MRGKLRERAVREQAEVGFWRFRRRIRILIWNSIFGLLVFLVANQFLHPPMPYVAWPLLLAVVFGLPGALLAILLWVLIR